MAASRSAEIREGLSHPVIDGDAHFLEFAPLFYDYVRDVGGVEIAQQYEVMRKQVAAHLATPLPERRRTRSMSVFWGFPTDNTLDRMTATLPRLYYERLDEMGIDYAVLYPTLGAFSMETPVDELRRVLSRAFNCYTADQFREFSDRMTPAAVIPMHTPEEAIAELDHAASLGLKTAMIAGCVRRPIPAIAEQSPELARLCIWIDHYGLDSLHDYDPVWRRAIELGMPLANHTAGMGLHERSTPSSYVYNHIGHFAAVGEALCKSLLLGGVTRRFPELRVAFLEGGATTGVRLWADLVSHWEKRGGEGIKLLDPKRLDRAKALDLMKEYAPDLTERYGHLPEEEILFSTDMAMGHYFPDLRAEDADDYAACEISSLEELKELFVPNFFFGCEADDTLACWAFKSEANPLGAKIKVIMSSDNGHWDVQDMSHALAEAYELIEKGLLSDEDFEAYCFTNSLELYAGTNPNFFERTVLESAAASALAGA
ncbi:MAG: amidohydrolase family protein [Myxococcota bacterium]